MVSAVFQSMPRASRRDRDRRRGADHLQAAEAQDRPAQGPQLRGLQFEADQEQHDDDAELGEMHDILALAAPTRPKADGPMTMPAIR